jgi:outer membrane lipoprotein SlyB
MNKRALIIFYVSALTMLQLQGCSTTYCGTSDTYDLCEQILQQPDLLPIINKDREIKYELFGTGAYMSDMVSFRWVLKIHFS